MVCVLVRICFNFFWLFDDVELEFLFGFFKSKVFERLSWFVFYRFDFENLEGLLVVRNMLL